MDELTRKRTRREAALEAKLFRQEYSNRLGKSAMDKGVSIYERLCRHEVVTPKEFQAFIAAIPQMPGARGKAVAEDPSDAEHHRIVSTLAKKGVKQGTPDFSEQYDKLCQKASR